MTRCLTADRVVPASSAACPLSPPSRHDLANILSDGKLSADLWCIYRDFMFRSNVYLLFYVRISYCWWASVSMGWVLVLRDSTVIMAMMFVINMAIDWLSQRRRCHRLSLSYLLSSVEWAALSTVTWRHDLLQPALQAWRPMITKVCSVFFVYSLFAFHQD